MSYNTPPTSGNTYRTLNTSMSTETSLPADTSSGAYVPNKLNTPSNRSNGHKPTTSIDLAQQYELDMKSIRRSVFKEIDNQGRKTESYIAHVRIIEDSKSPSSRPPPNSPQNNKKDRFLLLSIKSSGRMRLHKAKESSSGIIQIGRSWDFDELTTLELDEEVPTGFICQMGKKYYWEVHTPKERRVWCTTLLENYIKYTGGKVPKLINCSVEYFHLEGSQNHYQNRPQINSTSTTPQLQNFNPQTAPLSPSKQQSKSFTNPLRSPTKSTSPDVTSLKKDLGSPLSSNSSAAFTARSATAAALVGAAIAGATAGTIKTASISTQQEPQLTIEEKKIVEEKAKQEEIERRRKLELEKRKQQELERRKAEELERRQAEELKKKREEEELKKEAARKEQLRIEKQNKIEEQNKENVRRLKEQQELENRANQFNFQPPKTAAAKRGLPSQALSEAPSQMSFEYGDENHYNYINNSVDSHVSGLSDLNNYIDGYTSTGEEETAPLNLNVPKPRENISKKITKPVINVPQITATIDKTDKNNFVSATEEEINKLIVSPHKLNTLEAKLDVGMDRKHSRARAFSRVNNTEDFNDNDVFELLEEIGYDPVSDDSQTLESKLLKELEKLQYDKIQTLTEVTNVRSSLKKSLQTAFKNCDHIDPILSLFGVELSTFKEDVEFIESQGKGLQVETTNEKLLMNELNDIVHSVEISDLKLNKLLNADIELKTTNSEIENILLELYNALLKIKDENNYDNDTEYHLSRMKALQEKKKIFEGAKNKFLINFKEKSNKLFKSVSFSLSSKLGQISSTNFESDFLKTSFFDKLSNLLTLGGLVSFVKSVSYSDYEDILDSFITSFQPVFENITTVLLKDLSQEVSRNDSSPFSFTSNPADLMDESYISSKSKLDCSTKKNFNLFTRETTNHEEMNSTSNNAHLVKLIDTFCLQLMNVVAIQQEFMRKLFGFSSSSEHIFSNQVKTNLKSRCEEFKLNSNFLNCPIESDRVIGDQIFNVMKTIFDPVFGASLRLLLSASKNRLLEIPAILCILKTYTELLAPTSHEYAYSSFAKVEVKISSVWTKELDFKTQEIYNAQIHCQIVNYVKAYPVFFSKVQSIIDTLRYVNLTTFGSTEKNYGNYYMLWTVIRAALTRNVESLKLEISLHENDANDDIDIDISVNIQKHLMLWLNYKWAFEENKNLLDFPKDLLKSIDDSRDQELHFFINSFGRQFSIGNVIRLVEDMENLVNNGGNPSSFAAYSVENIKSLMVHFKGDSLKHDIANIATELQKLLDDRCYNKSSTSAENAFSVSLGKHVEKEVYNNGMLAMCQLFISTFTKLSSIVDKYYTSFDVPVDKYIINFNFKKHYIV